MKFVCILLGLSLSFCTTTKPVGHRTVTHSNKTKTVVVDSDWMANYKSAEEKYDYRIPEDAEIKSENGKFRVPQAVIDHNVDMLKAKPL